MAEPCSQDRERVLHVDHGIEVGAKKGRCAQGSNLSEIIYPENCFREIWCTAFALKFMPVEGGFCRAD